MTFIRRRPSCPALTRARLSALAPRLGLAAALAFSLGHATRAEAAEGEEKSKYELGFHGGPLLPSKVPGVYDIMQGWGVRANAPTRLGNYELETFFARGDGVAYNVLTLNYRLDLPNEYLPVHFLLGFHMDFLQTEFAGNRQSGGWQYGGGFSQKLFGPFYARGDFQYRFSPGTSVYVAVGFLYRFGEGKESP